MGLTGPDARVLVDWSDNGVFTGTGEDVTSRVMSLRMKRGRDTQSQLVGRSVAGKLTMVLNNESGDYNRFNTASPLTGNLETARKVRIETYGDAFPYTFPIIFGGLAIWSGFIRSIKPLVRKNAPNVAIVEAWGALSQIKGEDVQLPMATSATTGTAIGEVLDEAGWPAGDRVIDSGETTMDRYWIDRQDGLTALRVFEDTEAGFLVETKDGKIAFESRHHRLKSPHTSSVATWSDAPGAAVGFRTIEQGDEQGFIYNELIADVQRYTVGSLAVLWTLSESGANSPSLAPGETRTFWARFPTPDAATDAVSVNAWTTLVENTDYEANTQSGGGGTDGSADLGIALSKFPNAMKIAVTNNGSVVLFLTLLQARGTPLNADDPVRITSEDAASQAKYGTRTYPNKARFIPNTGEAQAWADFNVSIFGSPQPIIRVEIVGNLSGDHYTEILERDISDRITLVANADADLWASGESEDFFIEAMEHFIVPGGFHRVIFDLSPATAYGGFWILGTSKLGGVSTSATRLAH